MKLPLKKKKTPRIIRKRHIIENKVRNASHSKREESKAGFFEKIADFLSNFSEESDKLWIIEKLKRLGVFDYFNRFLEFDKSNFTPGQREISDLIMLIPTFSKLGWMKYPLAYASKFITNTIFDYKKSPKNPEEVTLEKLEEYENIQIPNFEIEHELNRIFAANYLPKIHAVLLSKKKQAYKNFVIKKYLTHLQKKGVPSYIVDKIKTEMITLI